MSYGLSPYSDVLAKGRELLAATAHLAGHDHYVCHAPDHKVDLVAAVYDWVQRDLRTSQYTPTLFVSTRPQKAGDRPLFEQKDGARHPWRGVFLKGGAAALRQDFIALSIDLDGGALISTLAHEIRHSQQSPDVQAKSALAERDAEAYARRVCMAFGLHRGHEGKMIAAHRRYIVRDSLWPESEAVGGAEWLYNTGEGPGGAVYLNLSPGGRPNWTRHQNVPAPGGW